MKRRDFLIGGIGAVATGTTGCAGIRQVISPSWPNVTPAEMDGFLVDLDGAMNRIAENPAGERFLSELQQRPSREQDARLLRQGMRTLLLAGNFGDLSVAGQVHPGVQQRLQYSALEMDSTVLGAMDHLQSLSPAARADIQSALRRDARLGDRVLEAIDLEASSVGVPIRRRLQLRAMGKHIIGRLQHSSDMFIDEYVTKSQKILSQPGSVAETQRLMAVRMGEPAFKVRRQEAENAALRWQAMELQEIPIGYQSLEKKDTGEARSDEEESEAWYRAGNRLMGFGAITTVIGWLIIAIGSGIGSDGLLIIGLIPGVTVGPLAFLLGLVTILLGGLIDITDGP